MCTIRSRRLLLLAALGVLGALLPLWNHWNDAGNKFVAEQMLTKFK